MKPADLCNHPSPWFGGSSDDFSDVVISSRIRLARNIKGYFFGSCLAAGDQQLLLDKLKDVMLTIDIGTGLFHVDIDHASTAERDLLSERHLISRRHARGKGPRGVVIGADEMFTAMINEEDHLRMQVYAAGLQLHACWERINSIDDQVEKQVEYAFDNRLGYLTACPTNLGTGIRVSVMLHLPALKMMGQIDKLLAAGRDTDMAIRGLFGEGTEAIGDFFQLSNQVTLGVSETEVIELFTGQLIPQVVNYEREARQTLIQKKPRILDDKVKRAMGVLQNACLISSQEALFLLSQVRLGINLGRINDIDMKTVNELVTLTQPAHLQLKAGTMLDPDQRDSLRAETIRQKLHHR